MLGRTGITRPKRYHGLAHGRPGTVQTGLVDFYGLDGFGGSQRSDGRGAAVSSLVLMQCVRQGWDNWTQKGTMVLPMGALERGKAVLVDF